MKPLVSPIVLLLDILMLLILAMIMEKSPDIKIILPDKILADTIVVSSKNGKIGQYYDIETHMWKSISTYQNNKDDFLLGNIPCLNTTCKNISDPLDGEKRLYLRGKLESKISNLIADSCLTFPKQCTNVVYHINENGTIDYERLKKEYPIFEKILKPSKKKL